MPARSHSSQETITTRLVAIRLCASICLGDIGHISDCTEDYLNNVSVFSAACTKTYRVAMETSHRTERRGKGRLSRRCQTTTNDHQTYLFIFFFNPSFPLLHIACCLRALERTPPCFLPEDCLISVNSSNPQTTSHSGAFLLVLIKSRAINTFCGKMSRMSSSASTT